MTAAAVRRTRRDFAPPRSASARWWRPSFCVEVLIRIGVDQSFHRAAAIGDRRKFLERVIVEEHILQPLSRDGRANV